MEAIKNGEIKEVIKPKVKPKKVHRITYKTKEKSPDALKTESSK